MVFDECLMRILLKTYNTKISHFSLKQFESITYMLSNKICLFVVFRLTREF